MKLWPALLALLAACAGTPPPSPPPPTEHPGPPVLSGRILAVYAISLRLAHVKLGDVEISVERDGTFEIPLPPGGPSVLLLEVTAVDHRPARALIANDHRSVSLDLRLGTYPREATLAPVIRLAEVGGKSRAPQPMVADENGRFVFAADVPNGFYEYEICGVARDHCMNGTDHATWHPDGTGDYMSKVEVRDGHLEVALDPSSLPPPDLDELAKFEPMAANDAIGSASPSARMTRIQQRMDRLERDRLASTRTIMASDRPDTTKLGPAANALLVEAHRDVARELPGATGPVEAVALLAYVATTWDKGDAPRVVRLRELVPPGDRLWGLLPGTIAHALKLAPDPAFVEAFVRDNPDAEAVSGYLVGQLFRTDDTPEHHAKIITMLKEPRFARTEGAAHVRRLEEKSALAAGKPMPAFSFATLDDPSAKVTNRTFAGKYLVLDVWATWCGPCRAAMPKLHELHARYAKRKDIAFLSVSTDEDRADVVAFRKDPQHPMPWPNAMARNADVAKLAGLPSVGVPVVVLVDPKGTIVEATPGLDEESLEKHLARLLK